MWCTNRLVVGIAALSTSLELCAATGQIAANQVCIAFEDKLQLQFVTDIRIDRTDADPAVKRGFGKTERFRSLWRADCNLKTNECQAIQVRLERLEEGKPMGFFDLIMVEGMRVVGKTGKVFTIVWGPYRTFIVDLDRGKVDVVESGPTWQGRTESKCGEIRPVNEMR